jgi:hypothetical protein
MKQIVSVDKNCHFSAMAELQRNVVVRIKVVHDLTPIELLLIID